MISSSFISVIYTVGTDLPVQRKTVEIEHERVRLIKFVSASDGGVKDTKI